MSRHGALVVAFVCGVVAGGGVAAWMGRPDASTDSERGEVAAQLLAGVNIRPTVKQATLFAAGAFADLGMEGGIQRVVVRIVRRLDVAVEIEAAHDIAFGTVPTLCLVGPYSAPDDAGLEDPCWGQPDISDFVASRLARDEFGHPLLRAGETVAFNATLWRSSTRCDYAPGEWTARLWGDVAVDGRHTGLAEAPSVRFHVAIPSPEEPLRLVDADDTRYCGLATAIMLEQGEPALASPAP